MAPANGWPRPQRMFWIASARPNTSRPQSLACDIGVRKKPSVARGPKLIMEMRQPHSTMTTGVRQPIKPLALEGNEMAMCPESVLIESSSGEAFTGSQGQLQARLAHGRRAAWDWKSRGADIKGCGLYVVVPRRRHSGVYVSRFGGATAHCGSALAMMRSLLCPQAF